MFPKNQTLYFLMVTKRSLSMSHQTLIAFILKQPVVSMSLFEKTMTEVGFDSLSLPWDFWLLCLCPSMCSVLKYLPCPIPCSDYQRATRSRRFSSNITFPLSLIPIVPAEVNPLYTQAKFTPLYSVISFSHLSTSLFPIRRQASWRKTPWLSLFLYPLTTNIQGHTSFPRVLLSTQINLKIKKW